MKISNPDSRYDIKFNRNEKVLDVGGGQNPHREAHVVVDKYIDNNYHRGGNIKIFKNQKFVEADGEHLPFENNEFDYVFCCHVLEHVENPYHFVKELSRVAKKGYLETPSLIGEYLIPKKSHKWLLLEIEGTIHLMDKEYLNFNTNLDFGLLFQQYLLKNSLSYKIFKELNPNIFTVRYEWQDEIDIEVNSQDKNIIKIFTSQWDEEIIKKYVEERHELKEIALTFKKMFNILFRTAKNRFFKFKNNDHHEGKEKQTKKEKMH